MARKRLKYNKNKPLRIVKYTSNYTLEIFAKITASGRSRFREAASLAYWRHPETWAPWAVAAL
jgi:hypothetical protein